MSTDQNLQNVADLLSFDALNEAEKITGKSYQEDRETSALGFGLHMMQNEIKESALRAARDSHFRMNLAETLALYADMGFTEVLCDEFVGTTYGDEPAPVETFRILWHPEGILATVESYQSTGRNNTKVYYNIALADPRLNNTWSRVASGSLTGDDIWVGDHDAREGIRTNLARLREVGTFLPVWIERPFLWLVTYAETKGDYDYQAINEGRISRLPADVQAAIAGVTR